MVIEKSEQIIGQVGKVLIGKREIIERVLMTIYAGGHILLEDAPGVGKTTLALGFSKALGLKYKRVQFTPDTMPSDIVGFSIYDKESGELVYKPGAADCNLLLGDEINRTSTKTQAALLETMEEGGVTVDGITHKLPNPFICIATQNPLGSVGTQPLPDSQLDRFMVRLSIGYPDVEEQVVILKQHQYQNPMDQVQMVASRDEILEIQNYLTSVKMTDDILRYMSRLCDATRSVQMIASGVSPRGVLDLSRMSRAHAILRERDYVIPEDVKAVFLDVCAHRIVLKPQAKIEGVTAQEILLEILDSVEIPFLSGDSKK